MQSSSNGVILQNGTGLVANGDVSLANGCAGDEFAREDASFAVRKRKQRQLSAIDADIIRLIGQHLREMGFQKTQENLMEESGCALEHPKAANFRSHVIAGDWERANQSLDDLKPLLEDPSNIDKMRLLLLQEKYLELLEVGREMEALHCLRHELAPLPLHHSDKHIQVLTSYMMYLDKDELRRAAGWPGVKAGARERLMDKLQAFLPASVMLPPKRLHQLLTQALQLQVDRCPFHYVEQNILDFSLLTDHICARSHFPSETVHTLADHSDEVWYIKFSHDGTRLAAGYKDGHILVWSVTDDQPRKLHSLKGQSDGIACLAWSPDDSLLLSCGKEDSSEAIAFSTETWEVKCRVHNSAEDSLIACAWSNDGKRFYVGGTRGQFMECNIDGTVSGSWEGIRVQALATHPNNNLVYAADTHRRIRQYNFADKSSTTLVQEDHPILSFILSSNGCHALLNVQSQGVHVWDLQDRCLVRRYQGVTQGMYTIHSTYGGINDSFIASGSEDHHVYVWQHRRETPVIVLKGHSRVVNCVAWNPAFHHMLASASDDGTVRLWGTEEQMKAQQERQRLQEAQERLQERQEGREEGGRFEGDPIQAEMVQEVALLVGERRISIVQQLEGEAEEEEDEEEEEEEDTEGEGMEVHHSESSLVSETEPSLELERAGDSTSSLSSGRLDEGIALSSETAIAGARAEQSTAFEEIGLSFQAPVGGSASSAIAEARIMEPVFSGRLELLRTSLRGLGESSVDPDPEESRLSSDSSNGTPRPPVNTSSSAARLEDSSRTSGYSGASSSGPSTSTGSGSDQTQRAQQQQQESGDDGSTSPTRTAGGSISTIV